MYKGSNKSSSPLTYLRPQNTNVKGPKDWKKILKMVWKVTKISVFLFIIISMLWGCVQMYQAPYMVQQITDIAGNKVFAPGVSFEIIIRSLGENGGKLHNVIIDGTHGYEYGYNVITSWSEAFTKTSSPFYGFFVYPTAYVLAGIIDGFAGTLNPTMDPESQRVYGIAVFFGIFFTVLIIRSITLAFSWKSQVNQTKMQDIQLKAAEIKAKYKDKKDTQSKQKMSQETNALYKKEGISPFGALGGSFASLPFLFAIYTIIRSTRSLKIANIGEISLIKQPWQQIMDGDLVYLALLFVYLPLQILSMLLPLILQHIKTPNATLTAEARKSRKKQWIMQGVMSVVFIFVISSVASGVAIYWILSSAFQITQTLGFFFYNKSKTNKTNQEVQRRLRQEQLRLAKTNNK